MKTGEDYYKEYQAKLGAVSDEELIQLFNNEVGNKGWGTARASFLAAVHKEFEKRGFDFSIIGDATNLSFKNKIEQEGKKIKLIS